MEQQLTRIAVKIGSNVLTRRDGTLDVTRMSALVDQVAELHKAGVEIILVSSGAVASGRSEIHPAKKLDSVDQRQLFSAVGQAKLINRYYELFREHGIPVGQVLTMKENFATRRHYLNQKNCMTVMLENGVIPIVNENDTISVSELMFTDNDELSGLIASMMDAQVLIILSNIDGIYNGSPADPASEVIRKIEHGKDLSSYIQTSKSSFGRGGMLTKTNIARKVADEGITVIIANGKRDNILVDLLHQELPALFPDVQSSALNSQLTYTRFIPAPQPVSSVKKWIAHSEGFAKGELHIDDCATKVLASDKAVSILPIGITDVRGEFEKDDIVRIIDFEGNPIGVGKANCSSEQAREAMGKHGKKPVVHYDYLYIE
ncbi:glutamate 5-kinase [Bacteroides stercoris]|uniref:Glutamate 5-kinase n=1 Tax=Bacteroides stercoris TaxID=46506 RepID=A0A125MG58_BACSE|nr:glutamate 5-kinase [Bacteroides stercoris]KWR56199.1 glutamate 5-kinase [Bacteroides stercoris]